MFSPAKLVGISAVIALVGALMVATPPSHEATPFSAAAPSGPTEIAQVEGTLLLLSEDEHGVAENHDWGTIITDQLWTGQYDLDDDRLDGYGRARFNGHHIAFVGGPKSGSYYLENDGGSWVGSGHAWSGLGAGGWHHRLVLDGQGAYDGLTAILSLDQESVTPTLQVSGVVFDGGLPPMPDPAPTDIESANA